MTDALEVEENASHANIDLIRGEPKKAIRKLAWPMIISMALIMIYNLADSVWVSGLGADALAAIGFVTPLFMIVIGVGNGLGAGANSLIARAIGAKDKGLANNAALHSVVITIILGIVVPLIIVPLLPDIVIGMGGESTLRYALAYGNVTFAVMIVFLFSAVGSAILRSEGDVKRATIAMAITAVLNIVLDPIFIYYLGMGIAGAAWATFVSALISCIVMIYWMWVKRDTFMDLHFSEFHANKKVIIETLKVALPSSVEQLLISIFVMFINAMLVIVGTATTVGVYTAAMRVVQMAMIPLMGLGTALLTVIGAAYGARNYNKMNITFNYSVKIGTIISIILSIIIIIFAPQISLMFSYSSATAYLTPQIAEVLRILSLFLFFMTFGLMSACMFQGVGRGTTSLIITIIRSFISEIIFAYLFGFVFNLGVNGVFTGLVIGSFIGSMVGYLWGKLYLKNVKKKFSEES